MDQNAKSILSKQLSNDHSGLFFKPCLNIMRKENSNARNFQCHQKLYWPSVETRK